jgi:ribosomal protein S18 acetylase RimI-like enzyme
MEIVVSKANLDDMEGLLHVYQSDGLKHTRDLDSYPLHEWILDPKHHFIVAKIGRKPVGFVFTRKKGEEAKIDMFSITKKYRGKGVEKRLLDRAETLEEVSKIATYVPKSDKWMVNLFKKQGYIIYNEISSLFGENEPGLYMTKDLTQWKEAKRSKKTKSEEAAKSFLEENLGKLDIYLKP